jgi:hypothetical protein
MRLSSMRRLALVFLAVALVLGVLRRRRQSAFVEVQFEDGAAVRLAGGIESRDLLEDAYAILDLAA